MSACNITFPIQNIINGFGILCGVNIIPVTVLTVNADGTSTGTILTLYKFLSSHIG